MKHWTPIMDKTIAWSWRGDCMVCFSGLAYLITVKLGGNEKMVMWYEEGENRSRSEGSKSSMGIWGAQLKNNGIQVFEDKTAALIKDLQLTSCEKREEISFLVGGWGIERFYSCLVLEQLENRLCCGLDDTYIYKNIYVFIYIFNKKTDLRRKSGP